MKTNATTVSAQKPDTKQSGLHNVLLYVTQHWQLYVIFLLPALALTLVFKYIPMGGDFNCLPEVQPDPWDSWE